MTAEWEPPGIAPWLGFASDSTAVLGRSSRCSGTRFVEPPSEATLTVYGCQAGSGTVELRAGSITGRLLDSITITVRTPPTPTPTVTPSGELSATKTSIVVGDEVTVSAVNVSPSGQSVYIVTNGRLDFARPGTCHFEIGPRSSEKSTRSWTLEGCSPPGSGSVTLKTRHNGQTLVLDSITIDVSSAPTPTHTDTPTAVPTATTTDPVTEPTATTTDPVTEPTAEPTHTPTPTPSAGPTGWIRADPPDVALGRTTTVTAEWSPDDLEVRLVVTDTAVLGRSAQCADTRGTRSVLPVETTLTVWGCGRGTTEVELRAIDGDELLASVEIRVWASPPTVSSSLRKGYLWYFINWASHPDYTDFSVEWSNSKGSGWQTLTPGSPGTTRLHEIDSMNTWAHIKGIPWEAAPGQGDKGDGALFYVRVTGETDTGFSVTSDPLEIDRPARPQAIGHQHDHTVSYDLSSINAGDNPDLAGWITEAAPSAAQAWADALTPSLVACKGPCASNDDGMFTFHIADSIDCAIACVLVSELSPIDTRLGGRRIYFRNTPARGIQGKPLEWTDVKARDGRLTTDRSRVYVWVERVVYHEFGHTFGMADFYEDPDYDGLMGDPVFMNRNIRADDIAALEAIYAGHIRNKGW